MSSIKNAICSKVSYIDRKIQSMKDRGEPLKIIDRYEEAILKLEDAVFEYDMKLLKALENEITEARNKRNVYNQVLNDNKRSQLDYWTKAADRNAYFYFTSGYSA